MVSKTKPQNDAVTPDGIIPNTFYDNNDMDNSTPYVSAPSSPGRNVVIVSPSNYFYSAPSSPMHHLLKTSAASLSSNFGCDSKVDVSDRSSFEFDFGFSGPVDDDANDDCLSTMSSADELFLNGEIRPMKLSSHLQRPQNLAPLIDVEDDEEEEEVVEIEVLRGRDLKKMRDRSLRRKARSLSPLRTEEWSKDVIEVEKEIIEVSSKIENPSTTSSRSSSGGTSSKRWIFLKDFIRSKSDGSNSNSGSHHSGKFWSSLSFSHSKCRTSGQTHKCEKLWKTKLAREEVSKAVENGGSNGGSKLRNGIEIRRSAHEAHYTAKRAQAEEMRRKTFLPYRQGLLGCLGFSSKGYGAMDGITRALKSVSSR